MNKKVGFTTYDRRGCPNGGLLSGTDNTDNLAGRGGDDEIHGLGAEDYLIGGLGNDVIYGGPGNDVGLLGGGDGQRDKLYCGKGRDKYTADKVDYVDSSCEKKLPFTGTML
jgi:Ca2+-binding RTX toxin-like protein